MNVRTSCLVVFLSGWILFGAPLGAQDTAPPEGPTAGAKPAPDLCKDAIDPYNPTAERMKFFKAAGVDNEVDAEEFALDKSRGGGFVRPFDTWAVLVVFDKDRNGRIDWFEADAYRRNVRQRVLGAFDADKNGSLQASERAAANRALAAGKVPATKAPAPGGTAGPGRDPRYPHLPPPPPSPYFRVDPKALQDLRAKLDTDGDGRLSTEQWKEYSKAYTAMRKKWELDQYDANRDGQVDARERQVMQARYHEYSVAWARRSELMHWDKNKSGKLDPEELAAMNEYKERIRKQAEQGRRRYEAMIKKHDADGDGRLNETERKAYYEDYRRQAEVRRWDANKDGKLDETELAAKEKQEAEWKRRTEAYKKSMVAKWDTDGDGEVSPAERQAMYKTYQRKQIQRWDKDGDGKLSAEENKARYAAYRARYAKQRKLSDANGDGQVTAEETRDYWKKVNAKYDANKDGYLDMDEREKMNADLDEMEN